MSAISTAGWGTCTAFRRGTAAFLALNLCLPRLQYYNFTYKYNYKSKNKRVKEHGSNSRLDLDLHTICSCHHQWNTGHKIGCYRTRILTTTRYKRHLDLTEHAAIKIRDPILSRTDSATKFSELWDPITP